MTDDEAATLKGRVQDAFDVIPEVLVADGALGAIVSDPGKRRWIYSAYTIVGLVLRALGAGVGAAVASAFAIWAALALIVSEQAHAALDPWMPLIVTLVAVFAFLSGAYGSLSSQVSLLARANTPPANQIE